MSETTPQHDQAGEPSETELHGGRNPQTGRFTPGNKLARGNAAARKVARFRASMFAAVKAGDVKAIVVELLARARAGESWAVKLALEYLCGPPRDVDLDERLTVLEQTILGKGNQ